MNGQHSNPETTSSREMMPQRTYLVVALDTIRYDGHVLGHTEVGFYRNEILPVDPVSVCREWDPKDPEKFHHLCEAELWTETEANFLVWCVRQTFPNLTRVRKKRVDADTVCDGLPLRASCDFPAYTQELRDLSDQLGVPIAAYGNYDTDRVLRDEPLLTIKGAWASIGDRCYLCGESGEWKEAYRPSICVITSQEGTIVCPDCAKSHAPEQVERLSLAEKAATEWKEESE